MKKDIVLIQGILSISALICLVIGMFNLLTPQINAILYQKVFYVLIGISFFLQAPILSNKNFIYPMYLAAILCVIGAFIPSESRFSSLKTIGLIAGVILSLFNRPKQKQQ